MCLDVDTDDYVLLSTTHPRARKEHACDECGRTIDVGEVYNKWVIVEWDQGLQTQRMCAHCWATIELGAAITGCSQSWWWSKVHDLDPDAGGFVGDILVNHELSSADRRQVMRQVERRKTRWRKPDGSLYPLPKIPVAA